MNYPANLEDKLDFGKHKGKSIDWILDNEPTYIEWCIENITKFELDNETYEDYEVALEEFRVKESREWENSDKYKSLYKK